MNLSPQDFAFLKDLLNREAGIVLEPGKEYLCETRLTPVARKHGFADVAKLVDALRGWNPTVKAAVLDAMTTNETSFFRDEKVWRGLSEVVLPDLLERRQRVRRLDIWSGACSSGQEPYSLAMVITELLGSEVGSWRISIVGTDLSSEMVERTRAGQYSEFELGRGLSFERRRRFLERKGATWSVHESLKRWVAVRQMNLLTTPWPVRGPFDLVLLRNVLIYFSPETRTSILERIATHMAPDGYTLLGASEGALGIPSVFEQTRTHGFMSYRLKGAPATPAPSPLTAPQAVQPAPKAPPMPKVAAPTPRAQPISAADGAAAGLSPDTMSLLERVHRYTTDRNLDGATPAPVAVSASAPSGSAPVLPSVPAEVVGGVEGDQDPLERLRALRKEYQNAQHFGR
jgi:chemotaxis protein methyltransferase CheR